jgi:glycosyltransferase involved in cell wall biosynthesis
MIVAHSVGTLLSAKLASVQAKVPLIYDCHKLETMATNESRVLKVIFSVIERLLIRRVNAVIVVNDSIAEWYENEYGFRPYVLKAYPDARWQSVDSDKTKFRSKFGIPENDIIFLYQGLLSKGRRVEQLIDVFEQAASDRHLVFMGYGELEPLVREAASRCSRIHFHEAVPPDQLLHYTTSADVGICGVENICLSYYYALPNKIMEYIHAGIAVLSPDFPEMRKVVLENKCGWVHEESTDSIRTQVNNLTKAEIAEKAANSVVARSSLTWESQEHVLIEAYQSAIAISSE